MPNTNQTQQMINRAIAPDLKPFKPLTFLKPELFVLQNGVKIYAFEAGEQAIAKIECLFTNAGTCQQSQLLQANYTNQQMREGTKNHNAQTIAQKLDFCGAHMNSFRHHIRGKSAKSND